MAPSTSQEPSAPAHPEPAGTRRGAHGELTASPGVTPASAVSGAGDSCRPASWPRRQSWLPRPSTVPNYLTSHMRLTIEAFPPFSGALAGIITANAPLSAEVPSFWGQSGHCERQVHTDPANGPEPEPGP